MEIRLAPEILTNIGVLPVTNTLLASWLAIAVLVALALGIRLTFRRIPFAPQQVAELFLEQLLSFMEDILGDARWARRLLPIIATFFLFILISNWLGIFPGFGSVGLREFENGKEVFVPLLRSVHSDLTMTLAVAMISVVLAQVVGLAAGGTAYLKRFFNFSNPILLFVGLLEIVGEFAKILSFAFRLFGNIFAGEVLLVVMGSLVPFLAPLPFYGLELFVGFIQALVFTMLTLVFFKMALAEAEHYAHVPENIQLSGVSSHSGD